MRTWIIQKPVSCQGCSVFCVASIVILWSYCVIGIYCHTVKTGDKLIFRLVKTDRSLQFHCSCNNKARQASGLLLVELFCWIQRCVISQDLHFFGENLFYLSVGSKELPPFRGQGCIFAALLEQPLPPPCLLIKNYLSALCLPFFKPQLDNTVSTLVAIRCREIKNYTHTCSNPDWLGLQLCGDAGSRHALGRVVRKDLVARCGSHPPPTPPPPVGDSYVNGIK